MKINFPYMNFPSVIYGTTTKKKRRDVGVFFVVVVVFLFFNVLRYKIEFGAFDDFLIRCDVVKIVKR